MPAQTPFDSALQAEIEPVYRLYAGMARDMDPENGMGGKLVYVGELDAVGSRLVRAANIAGAASLSATADIPAQRQAIRDGVVDFLVTNLDEALRILKNEIRKRQAVAVAVSVPPQQMMREMLERGVLPDLLPPHRDGAVDEYAEFLAQGARCVEDQPLPSGCIVAIMQAPPAGFEAAALSLIPESDHAMRRWLRLSPRYLGPQMRRVRSLVCDVAAATGLIEAIGPAQAS